MSDTKCCLNGCFKVLPVDRFASNPRSPDGLNARCRACELNRMQMAKHGLTSADKQARADDQGGCAICHRTEPNARGWVVDHDRSCCPGDKSCESCRRAVLCGWCNTALGYAGDDAVRLRRMADYLDLATRLPLATPRWEDALRLHTNGQDGNGQTEQVVTAIYQETTVSRDARIKDSINGEASA